MPIDAVHEVLTDPPREPESTFELAARRMLDGWLDTGRVDATCDDLRHATAFLRPLGITLEPLPGCEVRLIDRDGTVVLSREAAVVTAIRRLVAREAERTAGRSIARAA